MLVMPVYISRTLKIPLLDLFRKSFSIPLLTGVLTACIGMACMHVAPPDSWTIFFLDILVTATLGGVLCLALGFSREERREQLARLWPRRSAADRYHDDALDEGAPKAGLRLEHCDACQNWGLRRSWSVNLLNLA